MCNFYVVGVMGGKDKLMLENIKEESVGDVLFLFEE